MHLGYDGNCVDSETVSSNSKRKVYGGRLPHTLTQVKC